MKFNPITQSVSIKRNKPYLVVILSILLIQFSVNPICAQNYSYQFTNTPLSEALLKVAEQAKVNIAFDADKLRTILITKNIISTKEKDVLTKLLSGTGYGYVYKHGSYLIVKSKEENSGNSQVKAYHVIGVVTDRETSENLPYANITATTELTNLSASTNGTFSINEVKSPLQLRVSYLGYFTLDTLIFLRDSLETCVLRLNKNLLMLNPVDISADKLKMIECGKDAGHITINPASFGSLPNMGEIDVFRTLQVLPGIANSESSSELSIRGGSADQNLVLFDGFTLYNLDHFFGMFSSINPHVIQDIQIYKGGYDSRYGERVSGIVDITGKSGNHAKPTVYGGINLISGSLTAEIPVGDKFTIVAAGRRTYNNVYASYLFDDLFNNHFGERKKPLQPSAIEIEPDFYFYDFNVKASYKISEKEKISISIYGGKDRLDNSNTNQTNNFMVKTEDINEWKNYGLSGTWMKQWNSRFFSNVQTGYSGYANSYLNNTNIKRDPQNMAHKRFLPEPENNFAINDNNELQDFSLSLRNSYTLNQSNQIDFGMLMRNNHFSYIKNADKQYEYNNLDNSAWLYSIFIQDKINLAKRLTIKPGIRINSYQNTKKFYIEPRLAANVDVSNALSFKMATGRYYQFLSKVSADQEYGYNRDFWILADDEKHPVISSNHFIVGGSYTLKSFFFDIEAYYKTTKGVQEYLYISPFLKNSDFKDYFPPEGGNLRLPSTFVSGQTIAYGLDLLMKYERKYFTCWVSYSLSKATQNFPSINNNVDLPAPYDQRHKLNLINVLTYKRWNFSVLYVFSTGQPYITGNHITPDFVSTRTYTQLPNYNRIDISANYTLYIKKINIKLGASIINVMNFKNYYDIYTRQFDFDNTSFGQTTLIKSQDITPNFHVYFMF